MTGIHSGKMEPWGKKRGIFFLYNNAFIKSLTKIKGGSAEAYRKLSWGLMLPERPLGFRLANSSSWACAMTGYPRVCEGLPSAALRPAMLEQAVQLHGGHNHSHRSSNRKECGRITQCWAKCSWACFSVTWQRTVGSSKWLNFLFREEYACAA